MRKIFILSTMLAVLTLSSGCDLAERFCTPADEPGIAAQIRAVLVDLGLIDAE